MITHLSTTVRAGSWATPFIAAVKVSEEESYVSNLHVSQPPQPGHRTQKANSLLSPPAQPLGYFYLPLSGEHKA